MATLLEEVQGFVESDSVEPRGDLRLATEAFDSLPGLDEDVLHEVIGVVVVVDHTAYLPVDLLRVEAHDRGEGASPALRVSQRTLELLFSDKGLGHRQDFFDFRVAGDFFARVRLSAVRLGWIA